MNTASYGKNGQGAQIQYAIVPCRFGLLLAAKTPRGLCCARLGDDAEELENTLRREFSQAEIVRDDDALQNEIAQILQLSDGEISHYNLPLDIAGTDFQWRVWRELQQIPYGTTTTYGQIAQTLDIPKSVRAVGGACARNGLALVIPCHRVLSSSQSLTGFRWGTERKAKLLEWEGAVSSQQSAFS